MKQISVKKIDFQNEHIKALPAKMDRAGIEFHTIGIANWANQYPYIPKVAVRVAYTSDAILLHYRVTEQSVRAVAQHDNDSVWEDSCCEFFVIPANDGLYYNVECNCAGKALLGVGAQRNDRERANQAIMDTIQRWSSLGSTPFGEQKGEVTWQLALSVPYSAFFKSDVTSLEGKTIRANFYKCGDLLSVPHFLSWNAIEIEKPDFHRPDFFGMLVFE